LYKLTLRQPLFIRIFHCLLALLMLIIVPTGFYIHHPCQFLKLDFATLLSIHVFAGFALSYLLMARAYYAIFHQNYRTVVFTWQDLKEFPALFKYYLFFTSEKPPERKYNAGQRLIYTAWFIFLSLANISGALAYKKGYFLPAAKLVGGIHRLDLTTLVASAMMAYTVPLHIYLALTENVNYFQSMLTGYSYVLKPGETHPKVSEEEKTRVRLPGLWLLKKVKSLFG